MSQTNDPFDFEEYPWLENNSDGDMSNTASFHWPRFDSHMLTPVDFDNVLPNFMNGDDAISASAGPGTSSLAPGVGRLQTVMMEHTIQDGPDNFSHIHHHSIGEPASISPFQYEIEDMVDRFIDTSRPDPSSAQTTNIQNATLPSINPNTTINNQGAALPAQSMDHQNTALPNPDTASSQFTQHYRPHRCGINNCTKSFKYPKDLRRHQKIHDDSSRIFKCPHGDCAYSTRGFCRQDALARHMRVRHKSVLVTD